MDDYPSNTILPTARSSTCSRWMRSPAAPFPRTEDHLLKSRSVHAEGDHHMANVDFLNAELERLKKEGLYNTIRTLGSPQGGWIVMDGRRVLNLCSNNYLGFGNNPHLVAAAKEALDTHGIGPGAVRSIAGTMDLH